VRTSSPAATADSSRRRVRRQRDDGGVSSIELAVIAPSLLLLIFLVVQAALYFYGRSVALQAAREGVSQLRLYDTDGKCEAQRSMIGRNVEAYSQDVGSGALESAKASPTCTFVDGGNSTVRVRVTGHAISLLGFTLTIDESATGRVEQFQDDG
jgi:Flp pilus assembly protein TadG